MIRTTVLAVMFAGAAQASTFMFEDARGTWIDSQYGGISEVRKLYDDELSVITLEYNTCMAGGLEFYDPEDCPSLLQFERARAQGAFASFEEYYEAHLRVAIAEHAIKAWEMEGLRVEALGHSFFPYDARYSYLGACETPGDGVGPRGARITLTNGEVLHSIDLRMGQSGYDTGLVIASGGNTVQLPSAFDGTFVFGPEFQGASSFTVQAGISDLTGIMGFSYDRLVTVAPVPLPASMTLFGVAFAGLGALRRRQNS